MGGGGAHSSVGGIGGGGILSPFPVPFPFSFLVPSESHLLFLGFSFPFAIEFVSVVVEEVAGAEELRMFAKRESKSPSASMDPFGSFELSPISAGAKKEAREVGIGSSSELDSGSDICISWTGDGTGEFS